MYTMHTSIGALCFALALASASAWALWVFPNSYFQNLFRVFLLPLQVLLRQCWAKHTEQEEEIKWIFNFQLYFNVANERRLFNWLILVLLRLIKRIFQFAKRSIARYGNLPQRWQPGPGLSYFRSLMWSNSDWDSKLGRELKRNVRGTV